MKNTNQKFTRKMISSFIIICLLIVPITISWGGSSELASGIMGAINTVGNSAMQVIQQNQMMAQNQSLINSLTPQRVQDPFFGCPLTAARSNFPSDICTNTTDPDQSDYQMASTIKQVAEQYEVLYDKMSTQSQNSPFPEGLQCIENSRKKVSSQLNDRVQGLQAFANKMKKRAQLFRDLNQEILDDLKMSNELLDGGGTDNTAKSRDLRKDFFQSDACNESLPDAAAAPGTGLRGIMSTFTTGTGGKPSLRKQSADFNRNTGAITKDIKKQVSRMKSDIKRLGVERWLNGSDKQLSGLSRGGLSSFAGLKEAIDREKEVFTTELTDIKSNLDSVGYALPKMDKNFTRNVGRFSSGFQTYFKKKFVSECTNSFTSSGNLTQTLLSAIESESSKRSGRNYQDYANDLKSILSQDSFIEDKAGQISALDEKYGGVISLDWQEGGDISQKRPSEIISQQITVCNQKFSQNESFSTDSSKIGTASQSTQLSEAKAELERAKTLESNIVRNLEQAMLDKVLNCDGNPTPKAGSCSGSTLSTSDANFCVPHAQKCAANIQACYAQVNNKVVQVEKHIKARQGQYNTNMRELVASQEAVLKNIQADVMSTSTFLKGYFPGAEFEFPKDLFVKMPKMQDSEFGVKLIGGGNLDFLEKDLPEQIEKLKKQLEEQKEKVTGDSGAIASYMQEQEQAIGENKARYEQLKSDCAAVLDSFENNARTARAEAQKSFAETSQNVNEFCTKYGSLTSANSPLAGCEGDSSPASLQSDISKVAAHLDARVTPSINAYRNICAEFNANGTETSSDSNDDKPIIQAYCEGNKRKFRDDIVNGYPESERESRRTAFDDIVNTGGGRVHGETDSTARERLAGEITSLRTNINSAEIKSTCTAIKEQMLAKIPSNLTTSYASATQAANMLKELGGLSIPSDCQSALNPLIAQATQIAGHIEAARSNTTSEARLCEGYNSSLEERLTACGPQGTPERSKCRTDETERFHNRPGSDFSNAISKLTSLRDGATETQGAALLAQWQDIGEQARGSCAAQASSQSIGSGLVGFDQMTMQQGASMAPSGSLQQ